MPSDFLSIPDFSTDELYNLFELAERMRAKEYDKQPLAGQTLAMIFMKSSTRTRVSFEVGTFQLGGHALFLSPRDVQLGRGEPIADTARVLSRYVNGIMIRTFAHQDIEELAKYADVPVINGLTDLLHPCQVLADLLTVRQHLGDIKDKKYAWIGDGNNMANSWINAAYRFGFDLDIACPAGYEPADHLLARAQKFRTIPHGACRWFLSADPQYLWAASRCSQRARRSGAPSACRRVWRSGSGSPPRRARWRLRP